MIFCAVTREPEIGMGARSEAIGIVGVGGLAGFLVEGLRHGGCRGPILLSPRNAARAADLACRFDCRIAADNQAVVDQAALVVVAVPPQDALATIGALRWREGQRLVCVAIQVALERLEAAAPGATVVRAMPSAACAVGLGATPIHPPDAAARQLFEVVGSIYELADEAAFDAATALAGYHLWLYALMDAMVEAAEAEGLPRAAAVGLVAALTRSAAGFALAADPAAAVRAPLDEHGRPGSMTADGMAVLDRARAFGPWRQAYTTALDRLRAGSV
jgi:pyrroline-5-carboxylate reductase